MNKNRKGFTLVELIVVVTIFGVILGAILNMIKPANNVYHDADATMESNVIGSGLIDYLDDELRYSTNVLVLKDYIGVPDVSFHVDEGEIVTLIGANGAGKTTTMHAISGLLKLASGEITYDGNLISKMEAHKIVRLGLA